MKFMEKVSYGLLLDEIARCYASKEDWTKKEPVKDAGKDEKNAFFLDIVLFEFYHKTFHHLHPNIPADSPQRKILEEFVREYEPIQRKIKRASTKVKKIKKGYREASTLREKIPGMVEYVKVLVSNGMHVGREKESFKKKTLKKLEAVL